MLCVLQCMSASLKEAFCFLRVQRYDVFFIPPNIFVFFFKKSRI
jgi:hypothetical protein